MCDDCPHYAVASMRILIIKLDALGDVLRTTSILNGLRAKYDNPHITWITREVSLPLFENNRLVDRVLAYDATETVLHARVEEFDLLINLDTASDSAVLASSVQAKKKLGFGFDQRGYVTPLNKEATAWLEMGAFDQKKKANTRSYQDIMLDICQLKTNDKQILLMLSDQEKQFAQQFYQRKHLMKKRITIGINSGASPRWQFKRWTEEGFKALLRRILRETDWTILLYGGPYERERNRILSSLNTKRIVNTGSDNSLRQFFALVSLSDVFLTGDTLALHVATALGKKVVAYFGPTSAAEIDSYRGQILKVQSDLDCLVCYKPRCDFDPNCMNSLSPDRMFEALKTAVASLPVRNSKTVQNAGDEVRSH
jgi:ADP-heptose:LPS heptosyltransferase